MNTSFEISKVIDNVSTTGSINCQGKKLDKSRRSWSSPEEEVLILALKDVITKGYKSENEFRNDYLSLLESSMKSAFSDTDICGHPHITSKVYVWKKYYSSLSSMLAKSGIGWNDTKKILDATNEAWEAQLKVDNNVRVMRYKRWPHYESHMANAVDSVLDTLQSILDLTSDEKVCVAELLVDNPNKISLFLKLDHDGRLRLSKRLLNP